MRATEVDILIYEADGHMIGVFEQQFDRGEFGRRLVFASRHSGSVEGDMDGRHFDEMTKKLALGTSRRNVLRGLIGGGAALAGLKIAGPAAAQAGKTVICHVPPGNPGNVQKISVGNPSLTAHLAHGDSIYGGCCKDSDCAAMTGECGVLVGCLIDDDNVSSCVYQTDNSYCADACGGLQCCEGYCADSFNCEVRGTPGVECDDDDACTSDDLCGEEVGECAGTAITCDADTECVSWGCDPSDGCVSTVNVGSSCQDGTGTCDESGDCVSNPPICKEDGQDCGTTADCCQGLICNSVSETCRGCGSPGNGIACGVASDCCGNQGCYQGTCCAKRLPGEDCNNGNQCCSGVCTSDTCQ